jgi:hypothetical protein
METETVRDIVDTLDKRVREVGHLPMTVESRRTLEPLISDWARLVNALALGPRPRLRACPSCGREGMAEATRCGFCWKELVPVRGTELQQE